MPRSEPPFCWENTGPVVLSAILEWCLKKYQVDTLLVTAHPALDAKGRKSFEAGLDGAVRSMFGKHLVKRFNASGWPGTELTRHTGRVYVIRFGRPMIRKMAKVENQLFNWRHSSRKPLPEDICVFRLGSKVPVLVSVTHEQNAYIIGDKRSRPPGFKKGDFTPKELYIWDGPYFCRIGV